MNFLRSRRLITSSFLLFWLILPAKADAAVSTAGGINAWLMAALVLSVAAVVFHLMMAQQNRAHLREAQQELTEALRQKQQEEVQREQFEQQRAEDERCQWDLRYQTTHDELTGLYNKRGFIEATRQLLAQNPDTKFSIVEMDIDSFKVYNDLFGIPAGDQLLHDIGSKLASLAHEKMTYGRFGADHFICCTPREQLNMDRLAEEANRWFRLYSPDYEIKSRFGIYDVEDAAIDVQLMCDRALLALQSVKGHYLMQAGRYTNAIRDQMLEEQWINAEMRTALDAGQFVPYFQPQYQIHTGLLTGAEVLVRWLSPEKGMISPGSFVPIFEKNGFVTQLDQAIWEAACKWLRRRQDAGLPPVALSVNVSRTDVLALDLPQVLPALVQRYHLPPSLLRLEVTESAYMETPEKLIRDMHALQDAGFTIEMDDFGSGYSSLNSLKDMPVDVLKLDMRFLSEGDTYGRSANILSCVMNMAKWLDLTVIAEGVETKQQAAFLKSIGCGYAQGYLYARPMPMADFDALLKTVELCALSDDGGHRNPEDAPLPDRSLLLNGTKTILLVDDSAINRLQLRKILGSHYTYLEAADGMAAMELLHSGTQVDAMMLDIVMPHMGGYDVLSAVRSDPVLADLPIIVMTTDNESAESETKSLSVGASDFIVKPFHASIIRHRLMSLLVLRDAIREAQTDGLTGLYNRTTIRRQIELFLRESEGTPAKGAILTMDIDRFKQTNDQYGHPYGDHVLVAFADALMESCGKDAMIGRLGGDEFLVMLRNITDRSEAVSVGQAILSRTRQIRLHGESGLVSCSIGVSMYPEDFVHRSELYAAADAALYEAKNRGKNQMCFYDELQVPIQ